MSHEPETEIRKHFDAWRAEVERSVPPFAATVSAALRRERSPVRVGRFRAALMLMVLAAAGAGLVLPRVTMRPIGRREYMPALSQRSLVTWSSPTSFLLETPGLQALRETPRFEPVSYRHRR